MEYTDEVKRRMINSRSGIIYESGIGNGYAYTHVAYNADSHMVTILYSCGAIVVLDANRLGDTVLAWAARCYECRMGMWPDMHLGSVGERLADRYAATLIARPA